MHTERQAPKGNRLGAGDGIVAPMVPAEKKKRPQVPSARKFATRGVVSNPSVKRQLREALEQYQTPPVSPMRRKSLSMAEITPVSRSKLSGDHKNEIKRKTSLVDLKLRTTDTCNDLLMAGSMTDADRKIDDAGRRVRHQLMLNAWRRRRSELAAMVDSRDRLQTQVGQLQMQVDVLQKLRESEALRRIEAVNESSQLQIRLNETLQKIEQLEDVISTLKQELADVEDSSCKLRVDLMNERNYSQTLRAKKEAVEALLANEMQQVSQRVQENKILLKQINEYEIEKLDYMHKSQEYEEALQSAHKKYEESMEKIEALNERHNDLERINEQLMFDKRELEELVRAALAKNNKMETKMGDVKKLLNSSRLLKKKTQEENEELRTEIERIRKDFQQETERQWWLKTGQFLYQKFVVCAYMLFPALPRIPNENEFRNLAVLKGSIALGEL